MHVNIYFFWGWQNYVNEIGDWVLCRLSMKKRSLESDGSTSHQMYRQNTSRPSSRMFDFMMVGKACSSTSSSCSSSSNNNVEVSSNAPDEETSGYIF